MPIYQLPPVGDEAKKRPLSIDPASGNFIFYEDVEQGLQKIVPIERLSEDLLEKLMIERQLRGEPVTIVSFSGEAYSNERIVQEIQSRTKVGMDIMDAEINYLKYFLSGFPKEVFEY